MQIMIEQGNIRLSLLKENIPPLAYELVENHFQVESKSDKLFSFKTSSRFNIQNTIGGKKAKYILNIKLVNDLGYINKFFECINEHLVVGGKFFLCSESALQRRKRILNKYPVFINILVYSLDFIFNRVFPKLRLTKKLYFFVKGNRNRVFHEIEILGRLYSCGFRLIKKRKVSGVTYMVVEKVSEPTYSMEPTYGMFIKLNRVGKNGKRIKVRKLRSMYAYSEFIQEYVYENYNLAEGGKLKRDPRVSVSGKIFRRFWVDELPMIWNLLNGDLKIVGVRPLSAHYLSLYPEYAVEKRLSTKPGLVPPFYFDMPKTFDEIVESELRYIEAYKKSPILTDIKYFFKAFDNIIFKGARSQ
ncbi:MAG: sugar transferase [Cytophagales bacterium CG12_big_fil_rev_8_21_14_0_65_40_12]|nr:MAG: sugar transferase [Cytophagales bacterium CG12_big_fil_rev_8_21_14_0_65_40_12]PIW04236.1 MAG: sugar transferase [Cytophagales bacterium CG17_big_fil_post_rev_8_21_14_2_50_40_13]